MINSLIVKQIAALLECRQRNTDFIMVSLHLEIVDGLYIIELTTFYKQGLIFDIEIHIIRR